MDQLHVGQLESTIAFADWVGVPSGARALDLGAGLGGPARYLASERGARVHAVELIPELHEAAVALTARFGLGEAVRHECAEISACRAEGPFDLVWIEHVDMHIEDKRGLYARIREWLAPDGRAVWHDWLAGAGGPPFWPLFWSADGAISFLKTEAELRADLEAAGLVMRRFEPIEEVTCAWLERSRKAFSAVLARAESGSQADEKKAARVRRLLEETENALLSIAEGRLVPFFAEAVVA